MARCYRSPIGGDKHVQTQEECLLTDRNRPMSPTLSTNGGPKPDIAAGSHPKVIQETERILVYLPGTDADVALRAYGEYLSDLLQGQTSYRLDDPCDDPSRLRRDARNSDLVLYGEPEQATLERVLFGSKGKRLAENTRATVLLAQKPRWPIRNILLVMRVEASEEPAVEWSGRLTFLSGAHLTILPLVPSPPLFYGSISGLQVGIESLLTPNTPAGEQLRYFLKLLNKWEVNGTLRVRHGEPLWQICWEVQEGDYDLVIIGTEQNSRLRRWLFGELVGPLVNRIGRPLLIAGTRQPGTRHLKSKSNGKRGDR